MTLDEIRALLEAEYKIVFGEGYTPAPPVEQGIGSPGNSNPNHLAALRREVEARARAAAAVTRT